MASQSFCWERTLLISNFTISIDNRGGTYVSGISDVVAANGDVCAVSIVSLLR